MSWDAVILKSEGPAGPIEEVGDKDFLLYGIKYGFDIVDPTANPIHVGTHNNTSARPGPVLYEQATQQIQKLNFA